MATAASEEEPAMDLVPRASELLDLETAEVPKAMVLVLVAWAKVPMAWALEPNDLDLVPVA